jgi:DNA invertase Pin-like site-specific DNA recombinase
MATPAFKGIDFTLPRKDRLKAAFAIGEACGNAWYKQEGEKTLLNNERHYPEEIDDWSSRAKEAWRQGALEARLNRLAEAEARAKKNMPAARRKPASHPPKPKTILIGYQRVSTDDQHLHLQRDALLKAGVDPERIYEDKLSGTKTNRPGLEHAIHAARKGDVLVVWRLDRLARSLKDLIGIAERLEEKGVGLRSLQEQIDTTSAAGRLFFHMMGALAEFERNLIRERTRAGLAAARRRGKKPGQKRKLGEQDLAAARALLVDESITVAEVAERLGVSPATLYREMPGGRGGVG